MALPIDKLGSTYGPATAVIDPDAGEGLRRGNQRPQPGLRVGQVRPAGVRCRPRVAAARRGHRRRHSGRRPPVHRPWRTGHALPPAAGARNQPDHHGPGHALRVGSSGTRFVTRLDSVDDDARPVLTQFVTTFVRGVATGSPAARTSRPTSSRPTARDRPLGRVVLPVDRDQTFRYSEASGDPMPIHLDDDVARSVGLPGIIVHGLCTMAFCGRAVIDEVADGDPGPAASAGGAVRGEPAARSGARRRPVRRRRCQRCQHGRRPSGRLRGHLGRTDRHQARPGRGRGLTRHRSIEGERTVMAVVRLFASAREAAGTYRDTLPGATVGRGAGGRPGPVRRSVLGAARHPVGCG